MSLVRGAGLGGLAPPARGALGRRTALGLERLDELRSVAPDVVHQPRHRVDVELEVVVRLEERQQLARVRRFRVEPAVPGGLGDDDRHAVVEVGQGLVRSRR